MCVVNRQERRQGRGAEDDWQKNYDTCVAQKPLCWKCPVYEPCEFREKKKFAAMDPGAPKAKAGGKSKLPR